MSDPSAFQSLMTALATRRPAQTAAEDERIILAALNKHAHELAEKIRAAANGEDWAPIWIDSNSAFAAAELIDPEAS